MDRSGIPLAIRRHRLPRFWLVLTLGLVAAGVGSAYWWEKQLPERLEQAAEQGRLDDCLRYGEQLAALRWLGGKAPLEQGRCRRLKAQELWRKGAWADALKLQLQLVNSGTSTPEDQQQLLSWQQQLESRALNLYLEGRLEEALKLLSSLNAAHNGGGTALGDQLNEDWNRQKFLKQRAEQLIPQKRWWEALDALNRIEHPWWKQQSAPLRRQVEQGIEGLRSGEQREHDVHGSSLSSNVPAERLNDLITQKLAQGMDDWQAFSAACRELGGKVVEAGPETTCRR
jgi:tetratricopeptide (TPR) repeat protein